MSHYLNRAQWVFTALFALFLALIAGLVFLVQAGQSMDSDSLTLESGEFDATATPIPPLTAKYAYTLAVPAAHSWRGDAQLWQAEATWPTGSNLQEPPQSWTLTFYSPTHKDAATVYVTEGSATMLDTRPVHTAPRLTAISNWWLDSPEAHAHLYNNGGEAFLTVFPHRTVILTLYADEPLRWQAMMINEGSIGNGVGRQIYKQHFSAENGVLITAAALGVANE